MYATILAHPSGYNYSRHPATSIAMQAMMTMPKMGQEEPMREDAGNRLETIDVAAISKMAQELSSEDLEKAIKKLTKAMNRAKQREEKERRRKEEEERIRLEQEEKRRKEEHILEVTSMDLPLDWDNLFDSDARTRGVHTDSIPDALIMSLTTLGRVDIEYIASVTGSDYKTVICTLKGSIFQNPETWGECFYKGWEMAEEYLSGNLMRKWNAAKKANEEYNGFFSDNIKAIEKVLPPTVATEDIYITLGSPWVPADIIDEFIIDKNFNFDQFDLTYSWKDKDFITVYKKKKETTNSIFLEWSKRNSKIKNCKGKAKYDKNSGKVLIYKECDNSNTRKI